MTNKIKNKGLFTALFLFLYIYPIKHKSQPYTAWKLECSIYNGSNEEPKQNHNNTEHKTARFNLRFFYKFYFVLHNTEYGFRRLPCTWPICKDSKPDSVTQHLTIPDGAFCALWNKGHQPGGCYFYSCTLIQNLRFHKNFTIKVNTCQNQ